MADPFKSKIIPADKVIDLLGAVFDNTVSPAEMQAEIEKFFGSRKESKKVQRMD